MQLFVKLRAITRDMIEAANVETTILICDFAGTRFDAAGEDLFVDAGDAEFVTLLYEFLELRRQVRD